jgi:chromate reductase
MTYGASMKVVGFSGSLRTGSFNTALLHAARELAPPGLEIVPERVELPLYNADLGVPESIGRLKETVADAAGVLFVTPEYNYSVPGVLKNAIDWLSRPGFQSVLRDKPVGMMSAATSLIGGARAQTHLASILAGMATPLFPWPQVCVGRAADKFQDGRLTDEATRKFVSDYLVAFHRWLAG